MKRANDRLYEYQKVEVEGDLAGRQVDAFRVFMERKAQLLRQGGYVGVVDLPPFYGPGAVRVGSTVTDGSSGRRSAAEAARGTIAPNSAGVRYPNELCGRAWL